MTVPENLEKLVIPLVNLEDYRFSPPGSMGWSEAEYEQLITDPERTIQTETFSPPEVPQTEWVELSLSEERAAVDSATQSGLTAEGKSNQNESNPDVPRAVKPQTVQSGAGQTEAYTQSPNLPSPPWLASNVSGKRQS